MTKVYILGLKKRGDTSYGLTSWVGDEPTVCAVYAQNPGCWEQSLEVEPIAIVANEDEAMKLDDWSYIGFGWEHND